MRSMSQPETGLDPQPSTMDEYENMPNSEEGDYGGVHVNSGIPNHVAYLMAEGLGEKSIGREEMGEIFCRALIHYFTRGTDFTDARLATIQSAKELLGEGSKEEAAVRVAWDAVKVYGEDSHSEESHDDGNVILSLVPGDDNLLFQYQEGDNYYLGVKFNGESEAYMVSEVPVANCRQLSLRADKQCFL